ncbi:HalOD1 output domain-containing protein [Halomarina halobia]|uniref:HalOD1 output domain-containing protein n=1 Tax=Halomarina halobia TaxID=3033386 RepID=A0ABD6A812_9EURY|nr:HalOD1 output domain-containing protein [Halomarina sp. PSR21]
MLDVSTRVVEAISAELAVDPVDLPPLYESVDPDALDALAREGTVIEFTHAGYDVRIVDGAVVTAVRTPTPAGVTHSAVDW